VPKVHNKPIKIPRKGSNKESKRQPKGTLVWRTGLSGVPPDSVRCTRELEAELATFEKMGGRSAIIHRTVRCASGATTTSRQRSTATAFNALQCAPESEQRQTAHRTSQRPHQSELQRSNPNGRVTWLAHRTVRCAMRQQSSPNGWFGGRGYKYPQPPTIHCIQVFHLPTHYKSYNIQF
jgi:hypothetical protein